MENKVFTAPAVAGVLKEGFIEARLHVDADEERVPKIARNLQLQRDVARTPALPVYVILQPATEVELARQEANSTQAAFLAFLRKGAGGKVSTPR